MKFLNKIKDSKFFKTHKEEIFAIPMIFLGFMAISITLSTIFPNSAFFDIPSQIETVVYQIFRATITVSIAWLILWIGFPQLAKHLRDHIYTEFDTFDHKTKTIITIVFFIALLLISGSAKSQDKRVLLLNKLETTLNVREAEAENTGEEVTMYLRSVKVYKPAPWCAAYVSYHLSLFNIPNPKSAWSPAYANPKDIIWTNKYVKKAPVGGDVITYYYSNLT
jgi:hypothetical protein